MLVLVADKVGDFIELDAGKSTAFTEENLNIQLQ